MCGFFRARLDLAHGEGEIGNRESGLGQVHTSQSPGKGDLCNKQVPI